MEFKVHDFNIGSVTVEYALENGELIDFHVYRCSQKTLDYIEITNFLDESSIEELILQIIDRSKSNSSYDESFEQEYTGEESIA